jgi:PAS domain S-box-containing protein
LTLTEFSTAQFWEQALEGLLDLFPAAVWACDSHLHFIYLRGDCEGVLGISAAPYEGKVWFDFTGTEDPSYRLNSEMLRALAGESVVFEWEWNKRSLIWSMRPLFGENDGAIQGILGMAVDLSIQRLLSERLLASEQRYRDLFEHAAGMAFTCDLEGKLLTANRAMGELIGAAPSALIGRCLFDLIVAEERFSALEAFRSHLGGSTQQRFKLTFLKGRSERIPVEISTRLLFDAGLPSTIQGTAVLHPQAQAPDQPSAAVPD